MTRYGQRAIRPGNTLTWEYWSVTREKNPSALGVTEHFETEAAALDCIRGLKAIGTTGRFGVRHHLTVEHSDPVEWLEEDLRKSES
jgi:hypothetical protein